MKIALVGAGLAGKQHIHTILNNKKCKLDLIIDPSQEAYKLSKKLNTQYFSNIEKALEKCRPDGVIIATPNSVHKKNAELFIKKKIPILGICYGLQLIAKLFGGKIKSSKKRREFGRAIIYKKKKCVLTQNFFKPETTVWMSHEDAVVKLPNSFQAIASTKNSRLTIIENSNSKI